MKGELFELQLRGNTFRGQLRIEGFKGFGIKAGFGCLAALLAVEFFLF